MLSAVFEHKIPAGTRPQTDAVNRAYTGTGSANVYDNQNNTWRLRSLTAFVA